MCYLASLGTYTVLGSCSLILTVYMKCLLTVNGNIMLPLFHGSCPDGEGLGIGCHINMAISHYQCEALCMLYIEAGLGQFLLCCRCRPNLCDQHINYFLFLRYLVFTCSFPVSEYTVLCNFQTSSYCISIHYHTHSLLLCCSFFFFFLSSCSTKTCGKNPKLVIYLHFQTNLFTIFLSKIIIFIHPSISRHQPLYHFCPKRTSLNISLSWNNEAAGSIFDKKKLSCRRAIWFIPPLSKSIIPTSSPQVTIAYYY